MFDAFKQEFLRYFSNNNNINHLVNTFTTIKQRDTEAITTYLGQFYRCLRQIQAINADYFTVAQILNQFIRGLCSSIFQCICSLHPADLQAAVTNAKDFEATELEANHTQAVNLVMNRSSELDSKLKQFNDFINQKLEEYLADNQAIYQPPQRCNNQGNSNHVQNQLCPSFPANQQWQQETHVCHYCGKQGHIQIDCRQCLNNQQLGNQYQNPDHWFSVPSSQQNQKQYQHLSHYAPMTQQSMYQPSVYQAPIYQLQLQNTKTENDSTKLEIGDSGPSADPQFFTATIWIMLNPNSQNYLSLLVTPEDALANNPAFAQKQPLTSNIPPAIITEDKSLAAIFSFKFEETTAMPLFSGATLKAKLITTMYTDVKVKGQFIKLILDSTNEATKTPISEINDFPFKVNGIITLIKVIETTQYQALNTQELQLTYQGQYIRVPVMCGHFKTPPKEKLLIELEKEKEKPTWKAYQVSWADVDHNKLPPILS
ncbi:hypothetical protein G9A89_003263 [Geosiphon pyriformis]|nr:hypothetical protein G9A89_003263 [Geosiphon pyriformis]